MQKAWIKKSNSFKESEKFDKKYYLSMTPKQRLEIVQLLREEYYKIKKGKNNENRKRLRRIIKVVK